MAHLYAVVGTSRNKKISNKKITLSELSEEECYRVTRFPKPAVQELCDLLANDLEHPTARSHASPVDAQVLAALQFYASGSFQWMIGRSCGLSQSSVSLAVEAVTKALVRRAPQFISFPIPIILPSYTTSWHFIRLLHFRMSWGLLIVPTLQSKRHLSTKRHM